MQNLESLKSKGQLICDLAQQACPSDPVGFLIGMAVGLMRHAKISEVDAKTRINECVDLLYNSTPADLIRIINDYDSPN